MGVGVNFFVGADVAPGDGLCGITVGACSLKPFILADRLCCITRKAMGPMDGHGWRVGAAPFCHAGQGQFTPQSAPTGVAPLSSGESLRSCRSARAGVLRACFQNHVERRFRRAPNCAKSPFGNHIPQPGFTGLSPECRAHFLGK